ncbi:hypothetical protein EQP59_03620 [Ornithobacterium rhinotracheale]|uniref:Peptidyl-prolyl cis-trans isomerase n=1 Tax=Ornithobacterium rhinotracheale TaxID=28251 RepID=A0A3R5XU39_ORNRH|nr:hypothetical protein [Ornithobacterium rhinotracheale]QAR30506.1 hypothetical protein EQP59_03620 [Ornithobacterium rhinotracheale]
MKSLVKLGLISTIFFTACKYSDSGEWVAKYKNYELPSSELKSVIPVGTSPEDSLKLAQNYIDNWLKSKILMESSESVLSKNQILDIEVKVESYKNDLILNEMEEQWLAENPPKEPTEEEIVAFYNENPAIIPVKNTILKYQFIAVNPDQVSEAKKYFRQENAEALQALKNLANETKSAAQLNDNEWIDWKDFLNLMQLPPDTPQGRFLQKNQVFEIPQQGKVIVLKIFNFATQGQAAPLGYAKRALKNIILNKRKLNLLSQKKEELYQKAIYDKEIERK